jgi:hypothetical protein
MADTLTRIKVVRFAPHSPGGHRIRQAIMATTLDLIRAERELRDAKRSHWDQARYSLPEERSSS